MVLRWMLVVFVALALVGCAGRKLTPPEVEAYFKEMHSKYVNIADGCPPIHAYHGPNQITINFTERNSGYHGGVDIISPRGRNVKGEPILAAAPGRVVSIGDNGSGGDTVVVYHGPDAAGDHIFSGYMHLSAYSVAVGDAVERGQKVGEMGRSGTSMPTGRPVHLHFLAIANSSSFLVRQRNDAVYVSRNNEVEPTQYAFRLPGTNVWAPAGSLTVDDSLGKFAGFTYPVACTG